MQIPSPAIPPVLEESVPLAEALSLQKATEQTLCGFSFREGDASGEALEKTAFKNCVFDGCHFTGADFSEAWFRDVLFRNCDLSGVRMPDATLQRVHMQACRLTGANFSGAYVEDTVWQSCTALHAIFSEASFRKALFSGTDLSGAVFSTIRRKSMFRFERCRLVRCEFTHTGLAGQDLTDSDIEGIIVANDGELRGARVTALQACELARLLGVVIEG